MKNKIKQIKQLFIELDNLPKYQQDMIMMFLSSTKQDREMFLNFFNDLENFLSQNSDSTKN